VEAVRLEGPTVALVPLTLEHRTALTTMLLDPVIWQFTLHRLETPDEVSRYVAAAVDDAAAGRALAFVIVLKETGEIVGSTRYHSVEPAHRRLEIGHTWIMRRWQRTQVNTEAKFLLLRHAFEDLQFRRIQFRSGSNNEPSQRAILRLGAHEEGTLRGYEGPDPITGRDVVVFSILAPEWPGVKQRLEALMTRRPLPHP
jgi:RimJ/RimL family protein N-acetyltransferase